MEYSKWRSAEVVRVGFSWLVAASRSRPTASTSVSGAIKSSKIWRGTAILICNCLRRDTAVIGRMRHFSALFSGARNHEIGKEICGCGSGCGVGCGSGSGCGFARGTAEVSFPAVGPAKGHGALKIIAEGIAGNYGVRSTHAPNETGRARCCSVRANSPIE